MKEKNKTKQNKTKTKKEIKLAEEFIGFFFPKFYSVQRNFISLATSVKSINLS